MSDSPKPSEASSPTIWDDAPDLWAIPFNELLSTWDKLDGNGRHAEAVRALAKIDRYYLLIKVLKCYYAWHPWVYARCREVERAPDGYIDIWGREHFKSTIITFAGAIQEILKNPDITIGIISHTKQIAKGFLAQLQREFESNDTLKMLFPDILWQKPAKESPSWSLDNGLIGKRSSNPKEATLEAHGLVDGQPTSKHFQLLIYDDVVTRESVYTPEQIIKTTEAWELSDNIGAQGGRKWHVGTRYNFADTYSEIIKRGAAKPRIYPATHDGTIGGRPVLLSQEDWDRKVRDQGEAMVSCQLLANPLAGHQRMFDIKDYQTYEVRPETLNVFILVDPARSKKQGSANTAMVVLGVDYGLNKYLLDGMNHKMDLKERWEAMRLLYTNWVRAPGVQSCRVGYERFGAIADLDYFNERRLLERIPMPIEELEWPRDGEGSKVDRVQRLVPDMRNHRVYLPYATDPKNLTKLQRDMDGRGYGYRISRIIKRKDENGNVYDLTEHLKQQTHYFPFGGLKDLVDALSRIYDMDAKAPAILDDQQLLEPEFT